MEQYKCDFIEFALSRNVLKFGEFTLKSGRKSPYFFNAGLFNTGADLARLGEFYAAAIQASAVIFIMLFIMMTKIYFSSFIRQIQHDKHAFLANGYCIADLVR